MPSIIEVDTIKNKTGTQNTVLSTDGSGNVTIANSSFTGTIGSNATFPAGSVVQVVTNASNVEYGESIGSTLWQYDELDTSITLKQANSKILVHFNFGSVQFGNSNLGYAKVQYKLGSGSYTDLTPIGSHTTAGVKHHMAVNLYYANYMSDVASMTLPHTTSSAKGTVITYSVFFYGESSTAEFFINRSSRNAVNDFSTVSTCTLMEIAT